MIWRESLTLERILQEQEEDKMSKKPIVKKDIKDYVKELHTNRKVRNADNVERDIDCLIVELTQSLHDNINNMDLELRVQTLETIGKISIGLKKQKVEMLKADNEKRKFDLIDEYRNGPKKVEHEDSMTIVQIPQEDANN